MIKMLSHISKDYRRNLFSLAIVALILLTSCPIKSNIRSWMGMPTKTEQGTVKGNHDFLGSTLEKCTLMDASDTMASPIPMNGSSLLPAILLTVTFLFLVPTLSKEHIHPLYRDDKLTGTLPIFLAYRQLII